MLEKIRRHSGKIFVFVINLLLMATAVLAIRAKDQNRLLKQAEDSALKSESDTTVNTETPVSDPNSFQGQLDQPANADQTSQSEFLPAGTAPPAVPAKVVPPGATQKKTSPAPPKTTKKSSTKSSSSSSNTSSSSTTSSSSNAKTKTS